MYVTSNNIRGKTKSYTFDYYNTFHLLFREYDTSMGINSDRYAGKRKDGSSYRRVFIVWREI